MFSGEIPAKGWIYKKLDTVSYSNNRRSSSHTFKKMFFSFFTWEGVVWGCNSADEQDTGCDKASWMRGGT